MAEHRWVAFLRGMNLGGRRLTNDELVAAVEACGCGDVEAYQASGNVLLGDDRDAEALAAALEDGLERELGYAVPVFLRDAEEVRTIAQATPFTDEHLTGRGRPQVILLARALSSEALDEVEQLVPDDDVLVAVGRELHWLPAAGVGRSTFDFQRLDRVTGGTTVRTHATIQRLAAKYL